MECSVSVVLLSMLKSKRVDCENVIRETVVYGGPFCLFFFPFFFLKSECTSVLLHIPVSLCIYLFIYYLILLPFLLFAFSQASFWKYS